MAQLTLDVPESRQLVDWDPTNWFSATWRNSQPLERLPARKFTTAEGKANFAALAVDWGRAPFELQLSNEEALFWFASCFGKGLGDCSKLAEITAAAQAGQGKISLESMKVLLKKSRFDKDRAHGLVPLQVLHQLMTDTDLAALLCECPTMPTVLTAYRKRVLPFLTEASKLQVQKTVSTYVAKARWDSDSNFAFYMAACLGMYEVTKPLVESWKDSYGVQCDSRSRSLQLIIFGLDSCEAVVKQFKRLNLALFDSEQVSCWIAHTLDTELETVVGSLRRTSNTDSENMVRTVSQMNTAATAIFMFDRLNEQWSALMASAWLTVHIRSTVQALIEIASRPGKRADDALAYLRSIAKKEGYELINEVAEGMPPAMVRRAKEELLELNGSELPSLTEADTPDWLALAMAVEEQNPVKKKMPSWLALSDLPPVTIDGRKLNPEQLTTLINSMQRATLENPQPLLTKLKTHGDEINLDRFAWLLVDLWLREGGSSKENWTLLGVAFLGSDELATKLAQQIKVWPGESNHKRAVLGLECLRIMGTDNALMQINGIAEKIQFKGLKGKAEECMTLIAESRGLSRERLGDRIIPSLGFDRTGARVFDFGPRNFTVTLADDFKPVIVDQQGKVRAELPVPSPSDDQEIAVQSAAEWKNLKKSLRDLFNLQSIRLEQSMVLGRRWFADEFNNFLLHHPLMPTLLKHFVWAGFDTFGKQKNTFVIISRGELRTASGATVSPSDFSEIALIHPLNLTEQEFIDFKAHFATAGIAQAFLQLERPVQTLGEKEVQDVEIVRVKNYRIPAVSIVGVLEKRGWQRGPVQDGGLFTEHIKYFPGADITVVATYQGITTGDPAGSAEQYIDFCAVLPGKVPGAYCRDFEKGVPLGEVDRSVLSEILSDIELLKLKGKPNQ